MEFVFLFVFGPPYFILFLSVIVSIMCVYLDLTGSGSERCGCFLCQASSRYSPVQSSIKNDTFSIVCFLVDLMLEIWLLC